RRSPPQPHRRRRILARQLSARLSPGDATRRGCVGVSWLYRDGAPRARLARYRRDADAATSPRIPVDCVVDAEDGFVSDAYELGPMPTGRAMTTIDEQVVHSPLDAIFRLAADVEQWPAHLPHYRYVRM